jgi:enterobactin synthetase component D
MNIKKIEKQINFNEIIIPKIFNNKIRHISGTFDPNVELSLSLPSNFPNYSKRRLNEFLAGRICALKALNGLVYYKEILPIKKDKLPDWPSGTTGSISHTSNTVSAVVSHSNNNFFLGLDLENIFEEITAERLEPEVLSKSERRYLNLDDYARVITLIYSAKEAVFKAVNSIKITFLDFKEIEITSLDFSTNFFEAKLLKPIFKNKLNGRFAFSNSQVITGLEINI